MQRASGPLVVFSRPSDRGHARLGLSVGRRVGPAHVRNRIKRLLREAFRLSQDDLPALDLVINVRPHEPRSLPEYAQILRDVGSRLARDWERRTGGTDGG